MTDSAQKVCVFTGHRDVRYKHDLLICAAMDEVCEMVDLFIVGGARGADTIALLRVIDRAKRGKRFPKTKIVVPGRYTDQPKEARDAIAEAILVIGSELIELKKNVDGASLKERNHVMIDMAKPPIDGFVLAYFRKIYKSGTWSAMAYAARHSVPVKEIPLGE
jgi:hypothetical protein